MKISAENIFTYDDYLYVTSNEGFIGVHEETVIYKYDDVDQIHQVHDKSFKTVLAEASEMEILLRDFVGVEVETKELQQYKSEFITKQYKKKEADIVYKNIKKDVYYIVEHQTKRDTAMPLRMLEYCTELMRDVREKTEDEVYPIIVPIVLYTGTGKWNIAKNFAERQKKYEGTYKKYVIDLRYAVIDINKIEDERLIKKQDFLTNMMLMEKCKTNEERVTMLQKICKNMKNEEEQDKIVNYFVDVFGKLLETKEAKEFYENYKTRRCKDMTAMYESMLKEKEAYISKGKREGKKIGTIEAISCMIKNMLKYNEDDETIMKYTNAKREEIERIREEMKQKK